jgi:hypothetical protein
VAWRLNLSDQRHTASVVKLKGAAIKEIVKSPCQEVYSVTETHTNVQYLKTIFKRKPSDAGQKPEEKCGISN